MNCASCRKPMVALELEGIEIDHCIYCRSIWLDKGELELLIDDMENDDIILKSIESDLKSTEKKIRCPICLKKWKRSLAVSIKKFISIDALTIMASGLTRANSMKF